MDTRQAKPMYDLKIYPDPALRRVCEPVEPITVAVATAIDSMIAILGQHPDGVGIAANQIGCFFRIIVIKSTRAERLVGPAGSKTHLVMINPEIKNQRGAQLLNDGCLSIPGFRWQTERAEAIDVHYLDIHGKKWMTPMIGFRAFVAQHEVDHLNGTLFIDKARLNRQARRQLQRQYPAAKQDHHVNHTQPTRS